MREDIADRLQAIIGAVENHMKVLRACGLAETAEILAMAKLDLQMRLHGISDAELDAFCEALESATNVASEAEVIELASRTSRKA